MFAWLSKSSRALTIEELERRPSVLHVLRARGSQTAFVDANGRTGTIVGVRDLGANGCQYCLRGPQPHFYHAERWEITVRYPDGRVCFPVTTRLSEHLIRTLVST